MIIINITSTSHKWNVLIFKERTLNSLVYMLCTGDVCAIQRSQNFEGYLECSLIKTFIRCTAYHIRLADHLSRITFVSSTYCPFTIAPLNPTELLATSYSTAAHKQNHCPISIYIHPIAIPTYAIIAIVLKNESISKCYL